jgi:hypothetical protein
METGVAPIVFGMEEVRRDSASASGRAASCLESTWIGHVVVTELSQDPWRLLWLTRRVPTQAATTASLTEGDLSRWRLIAVLSAVKNRNQPAISSGSDFSTDR